MQHDIRIRTVTEGVNDRGSWLAWIGIGLAAYLVLRGL